MNTLFSDLDALVELIGWEGVKPTTESSVGTELIRKARRWLVLSEAEAICMKTQWHYAVGTRQSNATRGAGAHLPAPFSPATKRLHRS